MSGCLLVSSNKLSFLRTAAVTLYNCRINKNKLTKQAIKSVNAIAHFTDWIPGHVHDGVLGWLVFMIMAALFHMAPRMYGREIYSKSLMDTQFWLQTRI